MQNYQTFITEVTKGPLLAPTGVFGENGHFHCGTGSHLSKGCDNKI